MFLSRIRLWSFKEISKLVRNPNPVVNGYGLPRGGICFLYLHSKNSGTTWTRSNNMLGCGSLQIEWYSTATKKSHDMPSEVDFFSFIDSTLDEREGPSHRWLNKVEGSNCLFKKDGIFLILTSQFVRDSLEGACNSLDTLEKVKSLQQRYPSLQVICLQYCKSIPSDSFCSLLFWRIMFDYITFPILLSTKYYPEMKDGACYITFKGFQSHLTYLDKDVDLEALDEAFKHLSNVQKDCPSLLQKLECSWGNRVQIVKEPHLSSFLQNLLFYFPGCISVDEGGNRLFLSDVNHHRIIIFDNSGKILDAIGSSPGFEDAEFENAKLMRPAASFYDAVEDCLYFVDSENHAVRRADMERRVVETIYPAIAVRKSLWSLILDKLWKKSDADTKSKEIHSDSFLFPWHLFKSTDNNLYVFSRSFGTLWIMDLSSGTIREVVKGYPKILEICGWIIMEKSCLVKQLPDDLLQQQMDLTCSLDGIPHAGLLSSVAKLKDHLVICDADGTEIGREIWINFKLSILEL